MGITCLCRPLAASKIRKVRTVAIPNQSLKSELTELLPSVAARDGLLEESTKKYFFGNWEDLIDDLQVAVILFISKSHSIYG